MLRICAYGRLKYCLFSMEGVIVNDLHSSLSPQAVNTHMFLNKNSDLYQEASLYRLSIGTIPLSGLVSEIFSSEVADRQNE